MGSIFNKEALLSRLEGDEELAQAVVDVFISDFPRQLQALREAIENGNTKDAIRYAHSIKGASANVSAERLQAVALRLEKILKDGDIVSALENLPNLEEEFKKFAEFIKNPDEEL